MIYGSICSGIEAAAVAWHSLGWKPAFFSEIEPFPRAVLQHHYPIVPLHGDFTTIQAGDYAAIDLLVGGTPCQDFSVAGLRQGFSGDRGNLTLEFVRLAQRLRPRRLVWENVPGVLSIDGGRAFGTFLGGLADCGYGVAYRILDAQHFGVPQRRRRVFVVGHLGDWRPAAEVLFEPESLRRDLTPRRKAREDVAGTFTARARSGGWGKDVDLASGGDMIPVASTGNIAHCLNAGGMGRQDFETETLIAIPINTQMGLRGADTSNSSREGIGIGEDGDPAFTLQSAHCHAAAFGGDVGRTMQVRRLTPRECERLQGFPDDYSLIPWHGRPATACPDGPRYKALGNSMAVPVMRWIGERIDQVDRRLAGTVAA